MPYDIISYRKEATMSFDAFVDSIWNDDKLLRKLIEMRGGCRCCLSPPCSACSEPITHEEAESLGYEEKEPARATCPRDTCVEWSTSGNKLVYPTLFARRGVMVCPKCNQGFGYAEEAEDDPMRVTRSFC